MNLQKKYEYNLHMAVSILFVFIVRSVEGAADLSAPQLLALTPAILCGENLLISVIVNYYD